MSDERDVYSGILDNVEWSVGERVSELTGDAESIDVAVGFLFLSGIETIVPYIDDGVEVNILLGQVGQGAGSQLKRSLLSHLNEVDSTEQNERRVQNLFQLAQRDSVNIRVGVADGLFHPKLYLFHQESDSGFLTSRAIMGSSNMSDGGFRTNTELNLELTDPATIPHLKNWFTRRWNEGKDVTLDVIEEAILDSQFSHVIGEDIPVYDPPIPDDVITPFEATKRFIASHFRNEVESGTFFDDLDGLAGDVLTEFQQDAVRVGTSVMEKYGGVLISDSVGLGKSFIGAGLVHRHIRPGESVLVIAPKRLEDKWMGELFGDYLPLDSVDFMSYGKLQNLSESEARKELDGHSYVLIDEAHHLKNRHAEGYQNLANAGKSGRKFILLTATPIHNSVEDFDSLRRIFADENALDFSQLVAGLPSVREDQHISNISRACRKYDKLDKQDLEDDALKLKDELKTFIRRVIGELVIIRDRRYIKQVYPDATVGGQDLSFPQRTPELVGVKDDADISLINDLERSITGGNNQSNESGLNLPTLKFAYGDDGSFTANTESQRVLLMLQLLRRLESSIPAFLESIDARISHNNALQTLVSSKSSEQERDDAKDFLVNRQSSDGLDPSSIESAMSELTENDRIKLRTEVKDDFDTLSGLRESAREYLNTKEDGKVNRLRNIVSTKHKGDKILIFSEHVPTVEYLYESLARAVPDGSNVAEMVDGRKVGIVTGERSGTDGLVRRFAPNAQGADVADSDQIDVLISTEVLAEGHDLQDASVVINFDLHWNPMRLEQRIGRIDRLNSSHDEIFIYNFEPIGGLKKSLDLHERLNKKMENIASLIGKSSAILEEEEVVSRRIELYEKVQRNDSEYTDGEEGLLSESASDFFTQAREFCESHEVGLEDLQKCLSDRDESEMNRVRILNSNIEETILVLDFDVYYSDGDVEAKSAIVAADSIEMDEQIFGDGERVLVGFDRRADSPSDVFSYLRSDSTELYQAPISETSADFVDVLMKPDVVEEYFTGRDTSGIETTIGHLCLVVKNAADDPVLFEQANELSEVIANPDTTLTDNSRSGLTGTYNQLKHDTTSDSELLAKLHNHIVQSENVEFVQTRRVESVKCRMIAVTE